MYTVYGMARSRSLRVTWMLEELGAPYEFVVTRPQSPDAAALNPTAKIPILEDGDFRLTESAAICTYLADQHPEAGLVPASASRDRGRFNEACYFALTELEPPLWSMSKHSFVLPKDKRRPDMIETARWEFDQSLKAFDERLGDQLYAIGDTFTVADILYGHLFSWARLQKMDLSERSRTYAKRVWDRPARKRAVERELSADRP